MKRTLNLTLLIILFVNYLSNAQQIVKIDTVKTKFSYKTKSNEYPQEYAYSIGFNFIQYLQIPGILSTQNDSYYTPYFSGVILKLTDNQISYRLQGSYFKKDLSFENNCPDCEIANGKVEDYTVKVGFEKNITYTRLRPYYGADIGYRDNEFKGISSDGKSPGTTLYDAQAKKNCLVITPFIGLRLNIIDHLSITAEAAMDIMYAYEKQDKIYYDTPRTHTQVKYKKMEYLFRPLSMLTLQYNFGTRY
ncbi:hypothetical protein FW774_10475 [Pedobacter sp. BS3]|uniref:hypothetical protein n=1 Tax=Pedobacter sp. BS3 TaxID=2567937 RepID=UPI0011EFCB7C|nr:hypothetical protein [Pedobacter sp. BS3]TZF83876.1 hypothetical protein FW774_10475 [Pedobacter sp. BS3]